MANRQPDFVPLGFHHSANPPEQLSKYDEFYSQGETQTHGIRGNGRGRGKHGHHKNNRGGRATNNNHYNTDTSGGIPADVYGGPQAMPSRGLQLLPYSGLQVAPDGGVQFVPHSGYMQHPQSQPTYTELNGQIPDQLTPLFPQVGPGVSCAGVPVIPQVSTTGFVVRANAPYMDPPSTSMQRVSSFDNAGIPGSCVGSYGINVSPRQFTPVLHAPMTQRHTTNSSYPNANMLGPSKPISVAPVASSAMLSMLSVPKEKVYEGSRSASVGAYIATPTHVGSLQPDKQQDGKQEDGKYESRKEKAVNDKICQEEAGKKKTSVRPKTLKGCDNLEHLSVLSALRRSDLTVRLADLRIEHLEASTAIESKRSKVLSALKDFIINEQAHEDCALKCYDHVTRSLELACSRPPGSAKDNALKDAAKYMTTAADHSRKAKEFTSCVARCKDTLYKLNRADASHLNTWYKGMDREIMKALDTSLKPAVDEEEQVREQKEWQERIDAELEKEKAEDKEAKRLHVRLANEKKEEKAVGQEIASVDSDKVNTADFGAVTDAQKISVIATHRKMTIVKGEEGGTIEKGKEMDETTMEGCYKTSVVDTNVTTASQTNKPGGGNPVTKDATAEPFKINKDISNTGKDAAVDIQQMDNGAQPKKKNSNKRKSLKKRDSMDSKASSSTGLNEMNSKRPEKKDNFDTRSSSTASKKKGQCQGQVKVEGDKA